MDLEVFVPRPLPHQRSAFESPARFKLLRCGRRWGKDRLAFTSAIIGHGRKINGERELKGVAHVNPRTGSGYWIGWLVRDFPQAVGLWEEEFLPRFGSLRPVFSLNKTEMSVAFPNGGGIRMCTNENVDSLRGLGKALGGVVVNEAAHLPLEYAWKRVINWIVVDNEAWVMFMSTTNSGSDGNSAGLTPSYFNRLCLEQRSGTKSGEWAQFTGTGDQNSALSPQGIAAARAELTPGTLEEREEWFAELVPAGVGLAFPAWSPKVHFTRWRTINPHRNIALGMDWGIRSEAWIGAAEVDERGGITFRREWSWTDKDAETAGYEFAQSYLMSDLPWPTVFMCDSAMVERTGVGGSTILSEFQTGIDKALSHVASAPPLIVVPAPKGPGSRSLTYNQITKMLSWGPEKPDGTVPASRMPLLQIMLDQQGVPTCPMLAKDLATAPLDPKKRNDVDKTKCGFHAGDGLGYLLSGVIQPSDRPVVEVEVDRHPGFRADWKRRARVRTEEVEREEALVELVESGAYTPSRYGSRI